MLNYNILLISMSISMRDLWSIIWSSSRKSLLSGTILKSSSVLVDNLRLKFNHFMLIIIWWKWVPQSNFSPFGIIIPYADFQLPGCWPNLWNVLWRKIENSSELREEGNFQLTWIRVLLGTWICIWIKWRYRGHCVLQNVKCTNNQQR